jgi:hypothetical protein
MKKILFGVPYEWHFFATLHGKVAMLCHGGDCKETGSKDKLAAIIKSRLQDSCSIEHIPTYKTWTMNVLLN